MQLQIDTQLLAQPLPGARTDLAYRRVEMSPTVDGQVLLLTQESDGRLRLWLSASEGYTRWRCIKPTLGGVQDPVVLDFALLSNVEQGRRDGTLDLMLVADLGTPGQPAPRWFVWHRLAADNDAQAWTLRFADAVPRDTEGTVPEALSWGQANRDCRSTLLTGRTASGARALRWTRYGAGGEVVQDSWEPLPADAGEADQFRVVGVVANAMSGSAREGYLRHLVWGEKRVGRLNLVLPAVDLYPREDQAVVALNGSPHGWSFDEGIFAMDADSGCTAAYFCTDRGEQGVLDLSAGALAPVATQATLEAAPVPGQVRALKTPFGTNDVATVLRFERVVTQIGGVVQLRQTASTTLSGSQGKSTLLAADVSAFCACLCRSQHTTLRQLHVLVAYEQGGMELHTQDSASGQWSRYRICDDQFDTTTHNADTYLVRVRAIDDTRAPLPRVAVHLRTDRPFHGWVNGQSTHFDAFGPAVATTDSRGEVRVTLPVSSLSAPKLDIEAIDAVQRSARTASESVHPMDTVMKRLALLKSGADIREARGSDGRQLFAHLPIEQCDRAWTDLQLSLKAYNATLSPGNAVLAERPPTCVGGPGGTPLVVNWQLGEGDFFDDFGDILAYLWSGLEAGFEELVPTLQQIGDGLWGIALQIGDAIYKAVIQIASQAAEFLDWVLRKTLDISLQDIINWLGFVFDWSDIRENQRVVAHCMSLVSRSAQTWLVNDLEPAVKRELDTFKTLLSSMPQLDQRTRELMDRPAGQGLGDWLDGVGSFDLPSAQWVLSALEDFLPSIELVMPPANDALLKDLTQILEDAAQHFLDLFDKLSAWFDSSDFSSMSELQILEDLTALVGSEIVDTVEALFLDVIKLLADMLQQCENAMHQAINVPVLTPLLRSWLGEEATVSLHQLTALATSLAITTAGKVAQGSNPLDAELRATILAATSFSQLFETDTATSDDPRERRRYALLNGVVGSFAGVLKLVYLGFWLRDTWTPALRTRASTVIRATADYVSWGMSLGLAAHACASAQSRNHVQFPYVASLAGLVLQAAGTRVKDTIDIAYAIKGTSVPDSFSWLPALEMAFSGVFPLITNAFTAYQSTNIVQQGAGNADVWRGLIAMPMLQGFSQSVYSLLAVVAFVKDPETKEGLQIARTAANVVRSTAPLVQCGLLFASAHNSWDTPGLVSD